MTGVVTTLSTSAKNSLPEPIDCSTYNVTSVKEVTTSQTKKECFVSY
jgi:hypothetical protein